jgi:Chaperone of endosialidase/YadA head domain repeat (2 copies)
MNFSNSNLQLYRINTFNKNKIIKYIVSVILLLITVSTFAQQGINYKALIKDGSGNVLASAPVSIQFIIYEGVALTNNVYQESHTVNTDANGIVIVNIGQGTTSDVFTNINWGNDQHFLNVQVNIGSGLVDMGTTEFMAVPYAKQADTATNAANTTSANNGLTIDGNTAIDNGAGWHRSYGATGWYNGTYGGGIYMTDTQWIRIYGNKSFLVPSGNFQVGSTGNGTFKVSTSSGVMVYTDGNQGLNKVLTSDANGVATWQSNTSATGLEKITENSNTGWRLIGRDPARYGNIGNGAIDLSYSDLASSTTVGATGAGAITMGGRTTASGVYSTAIGSNTLASGTVSTAMGLNTKASSYVSTAIGRYNVDNGNPTFWVNTDPLFEIGNGTSTTPSNALTVLKNGNTDVNGVIRAQNNNWPTTGAGIEIAFDATLAQGYIQSYDRDIGTFRNLAIGALDFFPVSDNFTYLGRATNRWVAVYAVNGTIQTSDRRLKKDINNIKYGLNTIMELRPVSYKWKKGNQNLNLGLIAQEVQKLIPEVVDVGNDKDKTLGMKYTELIPVLIKAIQEQQKIIEQQETKNQQLSVELTTQNKNLEKRIDALEAKNQ